MSKRTAAIPPPSTLNDAHLPKIADGNVAKLAEKSKTAVESPLADKFNRLQQLRQRMVGSSF